MSPNAPPVGYVRIFQQLMMSESMECTKRLRAAGIPYEETTNGDPNEMPRGHFDLEIDLWVPGPDASRARELLNDVPTWTGNGRLGDQARVPS